MSLAETYIDRPQRWDVPFGDGMTDAVVDRLLAIEPFCRMDAERFPPSTPLRGILQNDARLVRFAPGDIIVREGDYGHSAFLILRGRVRVALQSLGAEVLGRKEKSRGSWWRAIAQVFQRATPPETRRPEHDGSQPQTLGGISRRSDEQGERVFLQDVPRVLSATETMLLEPGEVFGELSALTRAPRSATTFAEEEVELLEIRWQGLRDLMRRDAALKQHIDRLYRENSLELHLRETPLLAGLTPLQMREVMSAATFESYGSFDWNHDFARLVAEDPSRRIAAEPVIVEEGSEPSDLLLIRSGFVRLSRRHGSGHQTIAYLGKGRAFGLDEFAHHYVTGQPTPWLASLRAVGYVDVIRLPAEIVRRIVLPSLPKARLEAAVHGAKSRLADVAASERQTVGEATLKSVSLLEFLVEGRFINGTQAMMIDLDRCTRCDDCVRACAATHDNNPRFIRHGPKHGRFMLANACMHCIDPVCMIGCPTGAIGRDEQSGAVVINDRTCIGCGTCAQSCPYHNIRMVELRDEQGQRLIDRSNELPVLKATKCDLCVDNWGGPACQRACPHDALVRIDVSDVQALSQHVTR
jgi:Fe-S-cluster-containing dehydrogenase component/CRP-like cAMP-binding protein